MREKAISYYITEREKFQTLKAVFPEKYFNRNICAKYVGAGKKIFKKDIDLKPLIELVAIEFNGKGELSFNKDEKAKFILALGFLIEPSLDDFMKEAVHNSKLREEFRDNNKQFSLYLNENGKKVAQKELKSFLIDNVETIIERDKFISLCEPYYNEIVKKIFNKGNQTIHTWENNSGRIPNSEIRKKIARMFDMQYQMWEENYIDVQSFKNDIKILKKPPIDSNKKRYQELDNKILGEITPLSLAEESELEFISQVLPIKLPANLSSFSANFILNLAKLLKNSEQISDALYLLESLEKKSEPFIFYYRKNIQHLKAILLSHKDIQRWDDAIIELKYLYADGYHFENPEILTLLASNYKRKALYHPNGTLNYREQVDINLLQQANDLYEDAYDLSSQDKYYHAINRAYMMLIIDAIEGNGEKKKRQQEISKIYNELLKDDFPSNRENWWQNTTQIEFLLLLEKDSEALDIFENHSCTPKLFEIETTIRQLELYHHFTKDEIAKDFIEVLRMM